MVGAAGSEILIQAEKLGRAFGTFAAVTDLDLAVRRGESFAFLGPNGAGKTTTIRMLMGILKPTSGRASIAGYDCFRERVEVMRRVGYLPDEPVFYDYLRGTEIVRFVGELRGFSAEEAWRRGQALLERLRLDEDAEEFAANYSKGMKKKLAVVCALLHEPTVLICDEPTNGLDPPSTRIVHEILKERLAAGATLFFSTHLLDQAERLCDRVGIVHRGRLRATGTLEELRSSLAPGGSLEEIFFAVTREDAGGDGGEEVP